MNVLKEFRRIERVELLSLQETLESSWDTTFVVRLTDVDGLQTLMRFTGGNGGAYGADVSIKEVFPGRES